MQRRLSDWWLDYIARRGGLNVLWDLWALTIVAAVVLGFLAGRLSS